MTISRETSEPAVAAGRSPRPPGPKAGPAPGLLGSAVGAIRAAMQDEDWPLLRGYLKQLRARGLAEDELARVYATLRERRHPHAPTLEALERER